MPTSDLCNLDGYRGGLLDVADLSSGAKHASPWTVRVDGYLTSPFVSVRTMRTGDSAFGCRQMMGQVWEWTATAFYPFPGFLPDFPYRENSCPWFGYRKVGAQMYHLLLHWPSVQLQICRLGCDILLAAGSERGVLGYVSANCAWRLPAFILAKYGRRLHWISNGEGARCSLIGFVEQRSVTSVCVVSCCVYSVYSCSTSMNLVFLQANGETTQCVDECIGSNHHLAAENSIQTFFVVERTAKTLSTGSHWASKCTEPWVNGTPRR